MKDVSLNLLTVLQDCADAIRMLAVTKSMTGQNILVDSGTSQ